MLNALHAVCLEDATFHEIVHGWPCVIAEASRELGVWRGLRTGESPEVSGQAHTRRLPRPDNVGPLDGNTKPVETPRCRTSEVTGS